jgi:hypothetical protein
MSYIAGTYGNKCVDRGISTMRAALGIPGRFEVPDNYGPRFTNWLPDAFPGRRIKIWHSDKGEFSGVRGERWEYCGNCYEATPESDNWLTAFTYHDAPCEHGHFVIGEPITYDGYPVVDQVIAVEICAPD